MSPYFSPNSATAPSAFASSMVVSKMRTASSRASRRFASSSASSRISSGTRVGCGKSNRSRPGATSEPACRACSPSSCFNVQCTTCVEVWARAVASRRPASISAMGVLARADLPGLDDAQVHDGLPAGGHCVSVTRTMPVCVRIRPWSPT